MTNIIEKIARGEVDIPDVPVQQQADRVLLAYLGERDQLEQIWDKVRDRKYPESDYVARRDKLPILLAAYMTLRAAAERQSLNVPVNEGE